LPVSVIGRRGAGIAKFLGFIVGVAQILEQASSGTRDDVYKTTAGVITGMAGVWGVGLLTGPAVAGLLALGPLGWFAAAIVVVGTSAVAGYAAGKAGEVAWVTYVSSDSDRLARAMLDHAKSLYGEQSSQYQQLFSYLQTEASKLGAMNGTWLEGFTDLTAQQRATFTLAAFAPAIWSLTAASISSCGLWNRFKSSTQPAMRWSWGAMK
jgi:hypothetical protein